MCLLDTIDGALMMALYTSPALAKDRIAILYYSIILTVITVVVAIIIGIIQILSLILNVANPSGKFWVRNVTSSVRIELAADEDTFSPGLLSQEITTTSSVSTMERHGPHLIRV